ncbi:MAG: leucine-rich repeat protein [Tannerellaceae bacterium]|jgi:uncharacterized protein YjdB|nr:leucine-rich repeat protein [Tannerellaceae bacterium]
MKVKRQLLRLIVLAAGWGGGFVTPATADIVEVTVTGSSNALVKLAEEYTPALLTHLKVSGTLPAEDILFLKEHFSRLAYIDLKDLKLTTLEGDKSDTLCANAFSDLTSLEQILLPDALEVVGIAAFKNCGKLQSITFPLPLKSIHDSAFFNCSSLSGTLNISANVENIGISAFQDCKHLTALVFNGIKVKSIGAYAFSGDSGLSNELYLPIDLRVIAPGTFYNCGFTGTLRIGDYVSVIQGDDFPADETGVNFPQGEGKGAFEGCSKLNDIDFGVGLWRIGASAFSGCTGLGGTLDFPAGLRYIGPAAFHNIGITYLKLPLCLSEFIVYHPSPVPGPSTGAFSACKNLTELVISDRIEDIPPYTFYGCSNLDKVTVGKRLLTVGASAFEGCWKLIDDTWDVWTDIHLDPSLSTLGIVIVRHPSLDPVSFYVRHDGLDNTSGENGHTWATAFRSLEKAAQELEKIVQEDENYADSAYVRMEAISYTATAGSIHLSHGSIIGGYLGIEEPNGPPAGNSSSLKLTNNPTLAGKPALIIGNSIGADPVKVNLSHMNVSGVEVRGFLTADWDYTSVTDVTFQRPAVLTGAFTLKGKVEIRESLTVPHGCVTFHDAVLNSYAPISVSDVNALGTVTFDLPVWDPGVEYVVLSTWGDTLQNVNAFRATVDGQPLTGERGFHFEWRRDTRMNAQGKSVEYGSQRHLVAVAHVPPDEIIVRRDATYSSYTGPYIARGGSARFTFEVVPASATRPEVKWYSSDPSIVTIDSITGEVKSVGGLGSVDISAEAAFGNQRTGHYTLTVTEITSITSYSNRIPLDGTLYIQATTKPSGIIEGGALTWDVSSDDGGMAWVNWVAGEGNNAGSYVAYGVHPGSVTIRGSVDSSISGTGYFVVTGVTVTGAESDRLWIEDSTLQLKATVIPWVDDDVIVWTSDSLHVAEIDDRGFVTPIAPGTTTITAALNKDRTIFTQYTLHITNLIVSAPTANVLTGDNLALSAKLIPKAGKDTTLVWTSSDPSIATVDPVTGIVTGIQPGEVIITAALLAYPEAITRSIPISVIQRPVIDTKISVGGSLALPADLIVRGVPTPVQWVSSDPEIAAIDDDAHINAIAPGHIVLTGTLSSDPLVSMSFIVHVAQVTITPHEPQSIPVNVPLQLLYTVLPEDVPALGAFRWSSSDTLVAKVDSVTGLVSAGIVKGQADIIIASEDGCLTDTVRVTVVDPVDGLFITENVRLMAKGETHTLNVLMYLDPNSPPTIPDRELQWFSSDPELVSVYHGVITAWADTKPGIPVRIYARTVDGQYTSTACEVSVMTFATDIVSSSDLTRVSCGWQASITAGVLPADATLQGVKWSIENPAIAAIVPSTTTENICTIQGLFAGETTLYIESLDGRVIKTHRIVVSYITTTANEEVFPVERSIIPERGALHLIGMDGYRCAVFALTGQIKTQFQVNDHDVYQPLSLPAGVYILRAEGRDGALSRRFVVK